MLPLLPGPFPSAELLPAKLEGLRRPVRLIAAMAAIAAGSAGSRAQAGWIEPAPKGAIEAGVPPFAVLGPEALGLATPPVDLKMLPDGRLLAFGQGELAIGDGVRWEVSRQERGDPRTAASCVAVDPKGDIYVGVTGGFGRVQFMPDGRWRLQKVESMPVDLTSPDYVPIVVECVGNQWFWSASSGSVVEWVPGEQPRIVGQVDALERVLSLDGSVVLSDQSNGEAFELSNGVFRESPRFGHGSLMQTITCGVRLGGGADVVGTAAMGLWLRTPSGLRPWVTQGILAGPNRVRDLCALGNGLIAAAVDNVGIAIVDQNGRIVQSVDSTVDSRLSRSKRLVPGQGGVVWALLNDGIARIKVPSRFSYFEPLVTAGLEYAHVYRFGGRLWLVADGQVERGVYDENRRLLHFERDSPAEYTHSLFVLDGRLFATTDDTLFRLSPPATWEPVGPGPPEPYFDVHPVAPGRWLYAAQNQAGYLHREGGGFWFEAFPDARLGRPHNALLDDSGAMWLELGTGRVARVRPGSPAPRVEIFGAAEGVPNAWAQLSLLGSAVCVTNFGKVRTFDEAAHRFRVDPSLVARYPTLAEQVSGRPTIDARGLLWVTHNDGVRVLDVRGRGASDSGITVPEELRPLYFQAQSDGVMWMSEPQRLVRFDPSLPTVAEAPIAALITRIEFPDRGLVLYPKDGAIPAVPEAADTMVVHFAASNLPFGEAVSFEVQLSGVDRGWAPAGGSGAVTFSKLASGAYTLRVRPRTGRNTGMETALAFTVLTPWYRTRLAYAVYGLASLVLVGVVIRLSMYVERREKARLATLVTERTRELERQVKETTAKTEALRQSEERFRRLFDNAQDIIFRFRRIPDVGYDYISPSVEAITGYPPWAYLADPGLPGKLAVPKGAETICDYAREGWVPQSTQEVRRTTKDGRIIVLEERLTPVHDDQGRLVAIEGIARDVTARVEEQENRKRLEAQLLQSQKLESVGTLAGGIAHDFNNILTGILGYCSLAAMKAENDPELAEHLGEIQRAALRAKDLVTRILTFSRQTETRLATINLGSVVREALTLVRASTPATVAIETAIEDAWVRADPTQIHQIVLNLCTNGVHAMQNERGVLRIAVRRLPADPHRAQEVPNCPAGPGVLLAVSDDGCGMDGPTLARIFDPFFTTKASGKGTGLGMSIVQGIAANHGAGLRVLSKVGEGTTVEVYFSESSVQPEGMLRDSAPKPGRGQRIMVVDDETAIGSMVVKVLARFNYEGVLFDDSVKALEAFLTDPDRYQGIVTDLTMPGMTGVDLLQSIRAIRPELPAILASGYLQTATSMPPEVAHRTTIVSKPFEARELVRILGQIFGQQSG